MTYLLKLLMLSYMSPSAENRIAYCGNVMKIKRHALLKPPSRDFLQKRAIKVEAIAQEGAENKGIASTLP